MKTKIKTSIIIVALLFGFISSQYIMVDTKPSTTDTNNPPPTTPRPQPSTNGTIPNSEIRPRPSGSGLRGESGKRPEGPSNIPPKDGGYSDKLAAITDAKILKVKNVLRFLPLVEQDLLADCFNSNTDINRIFSPDCYKGNFTSTIKIPLAKGFSEALSSESKNDVKGVGCLKKTLDSFAGEGDSETKALITEDIDTTVAQQISLNQATSAFTTQILSVLNSRRRYLLTETKLMDESATQKDSEGYINGFIYTQDEKTTIVKAFESYANLLFSFNANLNNKVSNVQGMIGSLEKCKPESSTRLLQKTSGFTTKPSGKKQSGEKPSGKKPSGEKPRKLQDNTGSKLPINGTKPSGSEFKPSGPRPSGSEFKPSGPRPSGGKPKGKDGRPEGKIPEDLNKLKTEFVNTLSTKGGNWKLLGDTINTNMTPESGYKPNGSLQRAILTRIQGDSKKVIENELHKCKTNQNSTNEYLFYCKSGACFCEGLCPEDLNKIKSITLASNSQIINNMLARLLQISNNSATPTSMAFPSGSGKAPINQDDNVGEYTLAILALGGKRYSYFQALMSLSGAVLDFDAPGKSLGKSNTEGERKCKNALFSNSTNVETDKDCRGNLNEKCSKGMDGACKGAGLYERLVNRPLSEAALPVQCDNTYPTYSIDNCFNWLEPLIIKNTLSFSLRGFKELPMSIDRSFNKSYSLRELQSSVQVTVDPVTKSDSQAVIPSSLSKLESNLINIDGATAISAPSVGTYIQAFNEESIKLELSQKYFSFTFITLLIFLGLLI